MSEPRLRVLSLGAGVQSTTLALMAARGEIEPPDCAIFADTGAEPLHVYSHLARLKMLLPFDVEIISVGSLKQHLVDGKRSDGRAFLASIPAFLDQLHLGKVEQGQGRRYCTREYKVDPLSKRQRQLAGYLPKQRMPIGAVEVWLGISTDEAHRMKQSPRRWQKNRFPLIEQRMSRGDCIAWLERHGYQIPGKSACTFCPYHSDAAWLDMKRNDPASWQEACEVDEAIRRNQHALHLKAIPYLHRSMRPLAEADLSENQPDLFGHECEGMCGV